MYCTKCGTPNPESAVYCSQCGNAVRTPVQTPTLEDDPGMRLLLPVGRSWWAIAAGYLGLVSVLVFPAPLALLCGIIGIVDIRKNPEKHGMGRCWLGVIAGGFMTALLLLFVVSVLLSE